MLWVHLINRSELTIEIFVFSFEVFFLLFWYGFLLKWIGPKTFIDAFCFDIEHSSNVTNVMDLKEYGLRGTKKI